MIFEDEFNPIEISYAIKKLSRNKSVSIDNLSNEMFIFAATAPSNGLNSHISIILCYLFNNMIKTGLGNFNVLLILIFRN
jgi:hypothetical protein